MMKNFARLFFPAALIILFTSGCASISRGPTQRVEVTSEPAGARIIENGRTIGITPDALQLSRKRAHTLSIEKPGFKPESVTILTVPNEASDSYVRFGIDETFGAYNDLSPSEIDVALVPSVLPEQPGDEPFSELAAKIVEVDEQLASGEITPADHRYILSELFEFYQP